MVKSRRNVSRRKRQHKRQHKRQKSSRKNFRKMWGGGLVDKWSDEDLTKMFEGKGTKEQIIETKKRLREKKNWDDFKKDYRYGFLINAEQVKIVLEKAEQARKQAEERQSLANRSDQMVAAYVAKVSNEESHPVSSFMKTFSNLNQGSH